MEFEIDPPADPVTPNGNGEPTAPEAAPTLSPAHQRFQSCRWRNKAEDGAPECCGHRDVLPMTGPNGFDPEAWCPECGFYKLRRTPKKREYPPRY